MFNRKRRPRSLLAGFLLLFLVLPVWIFPLHEARADDTGLKAATAIVSAGAGWTNFTVAYLNGSEDNRARNTTNSSYGVISSFAFGISSEKIIDGIEVQIEGSRSSGTTPYAVDLSWNAGSSWTAAKTDSFTSSTDFTDTMGGSLDTWGRAWTASELSDANFQLRIYKTGGATEIRIDRILVRVYYTAPLEKTTFSSATSGTNWTVPAGVTSITVKAWGGGGGGATVTRIPVGTAAAADLLAPPSPSPRMKF